MVITDIRKTRRGRYALFGDGEFLFSVDAETLVVSHIEMGSSLSDGELALLKDNSDLRAAKDTALRYLSLRAYGERELFEKLTRRYDEHTCAAVVAQMCELELLDDASFALEKAKGMAQRGKSPGAIRQKLSALGIDRKLIEESILVADIDGGQAAAGIVRKKYIDVLKNGEKQKVMAALARQGFSHREIVQALDAVGAELEMETEDEWI